MDAAPDPRNYTLTITLRDDDGHETHYPIGSATIPDIPYNSGFYFSWTQSQADWDEDVSVAPEFRNLADPEETWSFDRPYDPGTYQVRLNVGASSTHAAGYITADNWTYTIVPGDLKATQLNNFWFSDGYVFTSDRDLAPKLGTITPVYYAKDAQPGDEPIRVGTAPEETGTYSIGFRVAASKYYNAYDSNGPVSGWTYTVKPAPIPDNYKVTLTVNGTPYDLDTVTSRVVIPSGTTYTVNGSGRNSDAGSVYAPCYRNAANSDDMWHYDGLPSEPGKYQIGLAVRSTTTYDGGIVTSGKWLFTIGSPKADPAKDAYTVVLKGKEGQSSYYMDYDEWYKQYHYLHFSDLPFEIKANSTVDYGTPELHYYKANWDNSTDKLKLVPDYNTEYKSADYLQPGMIYYVVAETAGSDSYNAARYDSDDNGFYLWLLKPTPYPDDYHVQLTIGESSAFVDGKNVVPYGSNSSYEISVGRSTSSAGAVDPNSFQYAAVDVDGNLSDWEDTQPTEPGRYQFRFHAEASEYHEAGTVTSEKWQFTIDKGQLTADAAVVAIDPETAAVTINPAFADKISPEDVTLRFYQNGTPVGEDGQVPEEPGTYQIGYTIRETDCYKELVVAPSSALTFTVKDAPKADNYTVTLNDEDITTVTEPIDYAENLTDRVTIDAAPKAASGAGDVANIRYVLVSTGTSYNSVPTVPGTYQVYLDVKAGTAYRAGEGLTSTDWQFIIGKSQIKASDFDYDPATNKVTTYLAGVEADDITIQYYKDGEQVTDLVNGLPRMAGTYQVGITVAETDYYKAGTLTRADWTYEKPKNFVGSWSFEVLTKPDAEVTYNGQPVTAVTVKPDDDIRPVNYTITYVNEDTHETTTEPPTDAGNYSWWVNWAEDDNTQNSGSFNGTFTIAKNPDLNDAIEVTAPKNVSEGDASGFEVTVAIKDDTLTTDDLEITYTNESGTVVYPEAPTKAGTYSYRITVKDSAKNFTAGSALSGNYTILSTEPVVTGGELTTEEPGALLLPGTNVILTADDNTDVSVFRQWVISVDGVEIEPTVEGLAKLGVDVEDDAAALAALQSSPFAFTMPEGKLSIYALTSNPEQEAFDKAVGTALIVTGATAATGAVYYFGTTAYIHSVLPEGMAIPQNREQLAVALWTLAGKPAVESTAVFTDVAADSEALPAIRWAVETGVLSAKTAEDGTSFYAGSYVTRAETALRIFKLQNQLAE